MGVAITGRYPEGAAYGSLSSYVEPEAISV
jgi:hypothetical protein